MKLTERAKTVDAYQNIHPSSSAWFAAEFGGLIDRVTGNLWVSTSDGVREAPIPCWLARDEDGNVSVLSEAEVTEKYQPVDSNEGYRMLGGRQWP